MAAATVPLAAELATYAKLRPTLTAQEGRFAVIAGEELIGTFDTYNDALAAGYAKRGLDPFLVKQISSIDVVANFTRPLRPVCHIFSVVMGPDGPCLQCYIGLSQPRLLALTTAGQPIPSMQQARMLVDTGASMTSIDKRFITALGLTPTGTIPMLTPSSVGGVPHVVSTYDIHLAVAGTPHHSVPVLPVMECDFTGQTIDGLIGRDILNLAHFSYGGPGGFFLMSV